MGIMVSKETNSRSELNKRITADLRQRTQSSQLEEPDFEEDSAYIEGTKKTGKYTWVWIVLVILAIISLVCIAFV